MSSDAVHAAATAAGKNDSKVSAAQLERWIKPIGAAVSHALLPELIRISAEYLAVGLQFGPRRKSKRMTVVDADADGFGVVLRCDELTTNLSDEKSTTGWYTALTDYSLGDVAAGPNGRVSWSVQLLPDVQTDGLTCGVGYPGTSVASPLYGVDNRAYGLCAIKAQGWYLCHNASNTSAHSNPECGWPPPPITLTADLATDTLHFRMDYVSGRPGKQQGDGKPAHAEWTAHVPKLATAHALISMGIKESAKLTFA